VAGEELAGNFRPSNDRESSIDVSLLCVAAALRICEGEDVGDEAVLAVSLVDRCVLVCMQERRGKRGSMVRLLN
jgi:hypothetical protein